CRRRARGPSRDRRLAPRPICAPRDGPCGARLCEAPGRRPAPLRPSYPCGFGCSPGRACGLRTRAPRVPPTAWRRAPPRRSASVLGAADELKRVLDGIVDRELEVAVRVHADDGEGLAGDLDANLADLAVLDVGEVVALRAAL